MAKHASSSTKYHHYLPLVFFIFFTVTLSAYLHHKLKPSDELVLPDSPNASSLRINDFTRDSHHITLKGAADIVNKGSYVRLGPGRGTLNCNEPIIRPDTDSVSHILKSLSINFEFSIPPENTDGHLTLFVKGIFRRVNPFQNRVALFSVDFNPSENRVAIVDSNLATLNASSIASDGLVLNSGKSFRAWLKYQDSTKTMEVRLSEAGVMAYGDPLLSYEIDLSEVHRLGVGIDGNSSRSSVNIYSFQLISKDVEVPLSPEASRRRYEEQIASWRFRTRNRRIQ